MKYNHKLETWIMKHSNYISGGHLVFEKTAGKDWPNESEMTNFLEDGIITWNPFVCSNGNEMANYSLDGNTYCCLWSF